MAKNIVIAGDYEGKDVTIFSGKASICIGFLEYFGMDKTTVESYELVTEAQRKSASSAVTRGLVGGALLGPVGLLAGLSAKSKGVYQIVINFKDGKRSLLEVDDAIYKAIIQACF